MSLSDLSLEGVSDPHGRRADIPPLDSGQATVSVVIAALNEAANLPHVLTRIPDGVAEVLLVDGNSVDDTIEVAKAIRPDIRVLVQEGRGKGNALACGFAAATGDIIVTLDADGSTDPAEIALFVEALLAGSDYVKGSRFRQGGHSSDITPIRSLGNRLLSVVANVLFRARFTDLCYGYNAFWSHCLPYIDVTCNGFEVEALMNVRMARSGLIVTEVASVEHARLYGESNLRAVRDGTRVLGTILVERVRRRRVPHGHVGSRTRPAELLGDA
jgi:glycosyltransferase involved in cell wall biosynthesis